MTKKEIEILIKEEINFFLLEQLLEKEIKKALNEAIGPRIKKLGALGSGIAALGLGAAAANTASEKAINQRMVQTNKAQAMQGAPPLGDIPILRIKYGKKYSVLKNIEDQLQSIDRNTFNDVSQRGRAATAIAVLMGGLEVYGSIKPEDDIFNFMGGEEDKMQGFAQFNWQHYDEIDTPEKYVKYFGDIITGKERLPNSRRSIDAVGSLLKGVLDGKIKDRDSLKDWTQRVAKFGGSNWEGVDKGWVRIPGLAELLIDYIKQEKTKK